MYVCTIKQILNLNFKICLKIQAKINFYLLITLIKNNRNFILNLILKFKYSLFRKSSVNWAFIVIFAIKNKNF